MTRPIRISRRLALAGGAAVAGSALIASNSFAQSTPAVPSPDDAPTAHKEAFVFHDDEDVLFEHALPGQPFEIAIPRVPFPPGSGLHIAFGPVSVDALKEHLKQVKADRDFAQGKTDLTSVNALIQSAEPLIAQAESKQPAPVVETPRPGMRLRRLGPLALSREARQAGAQLRAAQAQLAAALPGVLPSQAQRVGHELTMAHRTIAESTAIAKSHPDATNLATQAQSLYKQAYDAYQAGQYDKAAAHARAALATAGAALVLAAPEPITPSTAPAAPPPPTF